MSEFSPKNNDDENSGDTYDETASFSFEAGGRKYHLTPENTDVFLHEQVPDADHIFYSHENEFAFIYRDNMTNFDLIADFAERNDYRIHKEQYPKDHTYTHFENRFGRPPQLPLLKEITPRNERKVQFARYLLDQEIVNANSFG